MLRRCASAWAAILLVSAVACGGSSDAGSGESDADGGGDSGPSGPVGPGGSDSGGASDGTVSDDAGPGSDDAGPGDSGSSDGGSDDGGLGDGGDGGGPIVTTTYASNIVAGTDTACVISKDGALKCWGAMTSPSTLMPGSTWKQASVGGAIPISGCAIRNDDSLWCWLNLGTAPAQVGTGTFKYVGVALGNRCAVETTGALYCWGTNNVFGPLGTGDTVAHPAPTQIGTDLDWALVAPGNNHTCAIKTGGALYCWGWNAFGQVGDNTVDQKNAPVPIDAAHTYADVDTKGVVSCGVRTDGSLVCWGSGLGLQAALTPTEIDNTKNWSKVRLSSAHACAVKVDGALYCWGSNDRGQLGLPVAAGNLNRTTPQRIGLDNDWSDVAVGDGFTCATKKDETVRCWGTNGRGQLAQAPPGHFTPKRIGSTGEFSYVTAGPNNVCAVRKNGSLACWGIAGGMPIAGVASQTPVTIGSATDWKTVKPGYSGACATKTNDALHCWAQGSSPAPTGLTASAYDVAYFHQCAIDTGSLYCWGDGIFGKLGNGSNAGLAAPTKVGVDSWSSVAASFNSTCGIKADGTLWCFGFGYTSFEKQGTATSWSSIDQTAEGVNYYGLQGPSLYAWDWLNVPAASGAENDWTKIAVGAAHVCGIRTGGTLWCKGDNAFGQLGDGTLVNATTPVQVGTATDWVAVTAGTYSTCGLRGSGDLYCWGSNDFGESGDNTSWTSNQVVVP